MSRISSGVRRTATIDLSALRVNLEELRESDDSVVLDARADAYGHGLEAVVSVAQDAGITGILVSGAPSADLTVRETRLMTSSAGRRVVSLAAYGLDGSHRPVMTLAGEVIAVKHVEAGAGVSYGYSYRTSTPSTLALVGLGYADGVPRLASNRAHVHLAGGRYILAGRIAMDQFVVDCGQAEPFLGERVVLFGDPRHGHPSASEWAIDTQRSPLELTAGISRRVQRVAQ